MDEIAVLEVGREAVLVMVKIGDPIMVVGLVIGVIIALLQALTTIQEMTLTFVPKMLVMLVAMVVLLPFMMTTLIEFTRELFDCVVALG